MPAQYLGTSLASSHRALSPVGQTCKCNVEIPVDVPPGMQVSRCEYSSRREPGTRAEAGEKQWGWCEEMGCLDEQVQGGSVLMPLLVMPFPSKPRCSPSCPMRLSPTTLHESSQLLLSPCSWAVGFSKEVDQESGYLGPTLSTNMLYEHGRVSYLLWESGFPTL